METRSGDILNSTIDNIQYVAHQTNCTVRGRGAGVAAAIFKAWPHANTYKDRTADDRPGTIIVYGHTGFDGDVLRESEDRIVVDSYSGGQKVIAMNAQFYPGSPIKWAGTDAQEAIKDDAEARLVYFTQCLKQVAALPRLASVAFPYRIGCGLAGGDWGAYKRLLEAFEQDVGPSVKVVIYQRPEDVE